MSDAPEDEDAAPGWEAIDAALQPLYPDQQPKHWGTSLPYMLGGQDPIDGISAWKRLDPVPHWHFVTYGFSELYAKQSDLAELSGWGFELTFRLRCAPADEDPPRWVYSLLQNLGRYVFESGNAFADGHWMNANGPIALETDTRLCSIGIVADPELPSIDTPNGRVTFLQIVGLTIEEEDAIKRWNARKLLDAVLPHMPLWVTDLARGPLVDLPDVRQRIDEGARREGSSTGMIFTDVLGWETRKRLLRPAVTEITLGARQVGDVVDMLPLRLPFGHAFHVISQARGKSLRIAPGDADAISENDGELHLVLTNETMAALVETLRPVAGSYLTPGFPALSWAIEQSFIRDAKGEVIRVVG